MKPEPRKKNTLDKLERMRKALTHEEPDRVPVSDFFWGGFIRRWRKELNLPPDADRPGKVINRIGEFYLECAKAQIKYGKRS